MAPTQNKVIIWEELYSSQETQPAVTTTAVLQRPRTTRQNGKKNPTLLKHLHRIRSLSFCSPPEPFDENAVDTDSFPPPHPKSPGTSSSPFPVNHTFSSPTSSRSSFNTTTVPSGESSPCHLSCPSSAHFLFYLLLYTSHQPFIPSSLSSSTTLLYLPPSFPISPILVSLISSPVSFSPFVMSVSMSAARRSRASPTEPSAVVQRPLSLSWELRSFGFEPTWTQVWSLSCRLHCT